MSTQTFYELSSSERRKGGKKHIRQLRKTNNIYREKIREKFVFGFVFRLYLEFFWLTFFRSRTGYGDLQSESAYSVQIRENAKPKNSWYGHSFTQWVASVKSLPLKWLTLSFDLTRPINNLNLNLITKNTFKVFLSPLNAGFHFLWQLVSNLRQDCKNRNDVNFL